MCSFCVTGKVVCVYAWEHLRAQRLPYELGRLYPSFKVHVPRPLVLSLLFPDCLPPPTHPSLHFLLVFGISLRGSALLSCRPSVLFFLCPSPVVLPVCVAPRQQCSHHVVFRGRCLGPWGCVRRTSAAVHWAGGLDLDGRAVRLSSSGACQRDFCFDVLRQDKAMIFFSAWLFLCVFYVQRVSVIVNVTVASALTGPRKLASVVTREHSVVQRLRFRHNSLIALTQKSNTCTAVLVFFLVFYLLYGVSLVLRS